MLHQTMNQILKRPLMVKKTEIGGLIREFRLLTGLTQEQFGAYLGVTYGTINRWEKDVLSLHQLLCLHGQKLPIQVKNPINKV